MRFVCENFDVVMKDHLGCQELRPDQTLDCELGCFSSCVTEMKSCSPTVPVPPGK